MMKKDMSRTVQEVMYTLLTGDSLLMAKIDEIYDVPRIGASLPYITLGQDVATVKNTKTKQAQEMIVSVHSYSDAGKLAEAKILAEEVYRVLHRMFFILPDDTSLRFSYQQTRTTTTRQQLIDCEQKFSVFVQQGE